MRAGVNVQRVGDAAVVGIVELHFCGDTNVLWAWISCSSLGDDATHTSRGHCRVAAPCAFEVCDIVGGAEVALGSGESGEGEDGEGEGE